MYHKVCIIGPFPPYRGGIPKYNELLAKEFSKCSDVKLLSFKRQYPQFLIKKREQLDKKVAQDEFLKNVEFCIDSVNPISWFKTIAKIHKYKPGIVILPWWVVYWAPMYFIFFIYFRVNKIEFLLICHNVYEHENNLLKNIISRTIFKLTKNFLVHSRIEERKLKEIVGSKSIARHLIPLFNSHFYKPKDKMVGDNTYRLLFFGAVREYKGVSLLLRSLKLINDRDIELYIVGDFWDGSEKFKEYIVEEKISNVKIVDEYIPNEDIEKYFNNCDVVVLPYLSATGSAVIPLAYSYEKPVLVTNVGGLPDAVESELTGLVVEPNPECFSNGIIWFLENSSNDFSTNIRNYVQKNMSWSGLIKCIEQNKI